MSTSVDQSSTEGQRIAGGKARTAGKRQPSRAYPSHFPRFHGQEGRQSDRGMCECLLDFYVAPAGGVRVQGGAGGSWDNPRVRPASIVFNRRFEHLIYVDTAVSSFTFGQRCLHLGHLPNNKFQAPVRDFVR